MASCKVIQKTAEKELRDKGIITKSNKITDYQAFKEVNHTIAEIVRKRYGKVINNPVGESINGIFHKNNTLNILEDSLIKKGKERYGNISTGWYAIGENRAVDISSSFVSRMAVSEVGKNSSTKAQIWVTDYETGENKLLKGDEVFQLPLDNNLRNLFNDLLEHKNTAVLRATFPGLTEGHYSNVENGFELYADTKMKSTKLGSDRLAMEAIVYESGSEMVQTVNTVLNEVFKLNNITPDVMIVENMSKNTQGSAAGLTLKIAPYTAGYSASSREAMNSELAAVYLHEKSHVATISLLTHDEEYRKKMVELYEKAKQEIEGEEDLEEGDYINYGFKNVEEFLAEAHSNIEFQRLLATVPWDTNKSLLDKLVEILRQAISKALGIDISDSVLEEVILQTQRAMRIATENKLMAYGTNSFTRDIMKDVNIIGVYKGNMTIPELSKWANEVGLHYNTSNNQIGTQNGNSLDKNHISYHLGYARNSEYLKESYNNKSVEEIVDNNPDYWLSTKVLHPAYSKINEVDVHAINGDLAKLKAANYGKVITPNNTEDGLYRINTIPHYRATSYLGFGKPERSMLLDNASKIGNILDELGKRIFTEESKRDDYQYRSVSDFVKEEAWHLINKNYLDPNQPTREEFDRDWRDPVSEEGFNEMIVELEKAKERLKIEHGIIRFHPDLVVWDSDKLVAGEIDILGEKADGSFTVIDIKTRRAGLVGYTALQETKYNTKTKHTRQTSLYSSFLEGLGFKVNDPLIIMVKPVYGEDKVAHNQGFEDMTLGEKLVIIPLELENNVFNFTLQGKHRYRLRDNVNENRKPYHKFHREMLGIEDDILSTTVSKQRDKEIEKLQVGLLSIKNKLTEYTNLLKKGEHGGSIEGELAFLKTKIIEQLDKELTETTISEQIMIIEDFFIYGENQLKLLMVSLGNSVDERRDSYFKILEYKGIAKIAGELMEDLNDLKGSKFISEEEFDNGRKAYESFNSLDNRLTILLRGEVKNLGRDELLETYLGSKAEIVLRDEMYISMPDATESEKKDYINQRRRDPEFIKELEIKYREEIDELINSTQYDMSAATLLFNSDTEVNNVYVQYLQKILSKSHLQFADSANEALLEMAKLQKKLGLTRAEQREMIQIGTDGQHYLISEYKIDFLDKRSELRRAIHTAAQLEGTPMEKVNAVRAAREELHKWEMANYLTDPITFEQTPVASWKNPAYNKLNARQREALDMFVDKSHKSAVVTAGKSLIKDSTLANVYYHMLPGVKQTVWGAAAENGLLSAGKKLFDENFKLEKDDTNYGFENTDTRGRTAFVGLDGKEMFKPPIFYRQNLKENQNLDLFTIYALETQNYLRYEVSREVAKKGTILIDLVNQSKFYKTVGNKEKLISFTRPLGSDEFTTFEGDASNVSKMLLKMMKNQVYSMTQEYTQFGKYDAHKLAGMVTAWTTFSSMSFKLLGASNNWLVGHVSNAIEGAGGEFYTLKDMANARVYYNKNIMGIGDDIGRPVKRNIVNQIMNRLDVENEGKILNNEFEKKNKLARILEPGTSLAGYSMGEHSIQANVMLSILTSIKIINANGDYIDRDGKPTKDRKKGITMLQSYKINENGVLILNLDRDTTFTEYDPQNPLSAGGEAAIRDLIKDRVTRTQGAYDSQTRSKINREWYGGLFMQFRKHILPQTLNRYRGLGKVFKSKNDILDSDKYFNYRTKTEEYGYYVSFLRTIIEVIKEEKLNILAYKRAGSDKWKKMSKHERSNLKKVLAEVSTIATTLILAGMAGAAAEDDDDERLWALAFMLKKQAGDLRQYTSLGEMWRLTDSPMAALKTLDNARKTITQIAIDPAEEFTTGIHAGENKVKRGIQKALILDRMDQFKKGFNKRMYEAVSSEK